MTLPLPPTEGEPPDLLSLDAVIVFFRLLVAVQESGLLMSDPMLKVMLSLVKTPEFIRGLKLTSIQNPVLYKQISEAIESLPSKS